MNDCPACDRLKDSPDAKAILVRAYFIAEAPRAPRVSRSKMNGAEFRSSLCGTHQAMLDGAVR